jgi:two-component system cell cycle sensor histidine kinase/response regulator CckA
MATVLVVEDDDAVRDLTVMILKQKGYDVLPASNGLEALMVYSSYHQKIDLVLTDVDMPQMNGVELAVRIHTSDPAKKILLMSGRAGEDLNGAKEFPMLSKPFLPNQLVAAVDSALKP